MKHLNLIILSVCVSCFVSAHSDNFNETFSLALEDSASAQYRIGYMYEHGIGVAKDMEQALFWYDIAYYNNDIDAETRLAMMLYKGENINDNSNPTLEHFTYIGRIQQAYKMFQDAAEKGNACAMYYLAEIYRYGSLNIGKGAVLVLPNEVREAVNWYTKSADLGYTDAQYALGQIYSNGEKYGSRIIVDKDSAIAAYWYGVVKNKYTKSAEQGDAEAQVKLARMYQWGNGTDKDISKAVYWYRKAAEKDNADAQLALGNIYLDIQDSAQALYWFRKAAENDPHCIAYLLETELVTDAEEYYNLLSKAPIEDLPLHLLSSMSSIAFNDKDTAKAVYYLEYGAETGMVELALDLANLLYHELHDYLKAAYWYRQVLNQYNEQEDALLMLGIMYYNGEGVARNKEKAIYYLKKAAELGNEQAQKNLNLISEE